MTGNAAPNDVVLSDLSEADRPLAVPVILDAFTGIYRWHAKRTLREVPRVRAARIGSEVVGVAMLEPLAPEVGYLYYLIVRSDHRGRGIGRRLFDDALAIFRQEGRRVAYVATEPENAPMMALLTRAGFRTVARKEEPGYLDGGLGAWGLRSRMRVVPGEILLGRRLDRP